MTANTKPATPLPSLARMSGENDPFTILGALVPPGAPMRALLQIRDDRRRLVEALAIVQHDINRVREAQIINNAKLANGLTAKQAYAELTHANEIANAALAAIRTKQDA